MNWFIARMKEPSTWLGIAQIVAAAMASGMSLSGPGAVAIAGGVAGVLLQEQGAK